LANASLQASVNHQPKEKTMTTSKHNQPIDQIRDGALKATIWANTGEKGVYYSVSIARTYRTENGYNETNSFRGADLLKLARLAQKAYDRTAELRAEQAEAAADGEAA
jgi:hypothetical protein